MGHGHGARRDMDEGMAMENLVQHTFHVYDALVGDLGVAEEPEGNGDGHGHKGENGNRSRRGGDGRRSCQG